MDPLRHTPGFLQPEEAIAQKGLTSVQGQEELEERQFGALQDTLS